MTKYKLHNLINLIVPLAPLLQRLQDGNNLKLTQEEFLKTIKMRLQDAINEIDKLLGEKNE